MSVRRSVLLSVAALMVASSPAYAGQHHKTPPPPTSPTTYDVSYPQCGKALPASATGGIVGVNNGIVLSSNPCLASEFAWASAASPYAPELYANTGNPGPAYSSHWPAGQTAPMVCSDTDPNSQACSYDYGWNYGKDAFARAAAVTSAAVTSRWWLDVETGNSWETLESYGQTATAQSNDRASLAGAVAALHDSRVETVGIYSTSYQFGQIVGSASGQFPTQPAWVAGVGSQSTAQSNCASTSFTGGAVTLAQYALNGYDADLHCAS